MNLGQVVLFDELESGKSIDELAFDNLAGHLTYVVHIFSLSSI